ncbi:MAG: hypothetical protein U9R60_02450 [Bacteroidota bacterium]|nr:hypothetical protein [Bacteroidota bacterium]
MNSIYGKTASGTLTGILTDDAGNVRVGGQAAHDAVSTGNPVIGGGVAETTVPTAVSDGDVVQLFIKEDGRQVGFADNLSVGARDVNVIAAPPVDSSHYQIIDQLLDNDPTSVSSAWIDISDCSEVGFWITYNETEVGNNISCTVTVDISNDASNTLDGLFYDIAGTATAQSTETISADGEYVFWVQMTGVQAFKAPYIQVNVAGVNTDIDDTADIDCYIFTKK